MNWRGVMLMMSVAVSLTSGCASLCFMNSQNKIPATCLAACARLKITPTKYVLVVDVSQQSVSLFKDGRFAKKYRCSTSRFGIGQNI